MNRREFIAQVGRGAVATTLGLAQARGSAAAESASGSSSAGGAPPPPGPEWARGWNTWTTNSVLSHVLLPEGLALHLSFCHYGMLAVVKDAFFGKKDLGATAGVNLAAAEVKTRRIQLQPGPHTYDGSYTALTIVLGEVTISVESAHDGPRGLVIWIQATRADYRAPALAVAPNLLWNRPGGIAPDGPRGMRATCGETAFPIHCTTEPRADPNFASSSPNWVFPLTEPIGLSVGVERGPEEIAGIVAAARAAEAATHAGYAPLQELHGAYQSCLAWNTVYEPSFQRVITTSSRPWNVARLGYGMFCWDNFFYGWMMVSDDPPLARNAVLETFREMIGGKFVPNVANGSGRKSRDRSQPCIGGLAVLAMQERAPDRLFLEKAWDPLLTWNRWWNETRRNRRGLLSLGSSPARPEIGDLAEFLQPNTLRGAALESGMDNTPMYDGVPFDAAGSHLMGLSDVGINSLYAVDCQALAVLARELGRDEEGRELTARAAAYSQGLQTLWNESAGIFQNRLTDSDAFSDRISPTCFYPMLAGAATDRQVQSMVDGYLLNEKKFWGEWVLPSVSRDDPAFPEQLYWRGRIWAPLNFFVYLGLRRAGRPAPAAALAQRSRRLFENNWREHAGVFENFSPLTGQGGDVPLCDPFYPWTGLLVVMALIDDGRIPLPSILRPGSTAG